jgi:hypothetical protein
MLGCGEMFAKSDELKRHYLDVHNLGTPRKVGVLGTPKRGPAVPSPSPRKRKVSEMDYVTPIIEAMPPEIARRNRAVYDGPSRTLTIGAGQQERKRRKGN